MSLITSWKIILSVRLFCQSFCFSLVRFCSKLQLFFFKKRCKPKKGRGEDFSGCPMVKTLGFHCRGYGFTPSQNPACPVAQQKKKRRKKQRDKDFINQGGTNGDNILTGSWGASSPQKYIIFSVLFQTSLERSHLFYHISVHPILQAGVRIASACLCLFKKHRCLSQIYHYNILIFSTFVTATNLCCQSRSSRS